MPASVIAASIPKNLKLRDDVRVKILGGTAGLDSDMFKICDRIKAISPTLFIVQLEDNDTRSWSIMENTPAHGEMLVCKVDDLDARVLTRIRKMRRIPFEKRFAALEKEIELENAQKHEDSLEDMYEKMGGMFHRQLAHDGFITHSGKSFAKRGVALKGRYGESNAGK